MVYINHGVIAPCHLGRDLRANLLSENKPVQASCHGEIKQNPKSITSTSHQDDINHVVAETYFPEKHGKSAHVDAETAAYAAGESIQIDEATSKRLFWKINKRILFCMLGV
jgi:hypothetical protein